ncbi:MAG: porin, partial [Formosa sp.]|nr:porin [Formosa sp.]
MILRKLSFALALIALSISHSQEISDTSFGKGLLNFVAKDSSFSV